MWLTATRIYQAQEKFNSAAKAFKAALKANPKKYKASYNYAIAVESANPDNLASAIKVWESFAALAKKYPRAKGDLATAEGHLKELHERKKHEDLQ